MITFLTKAIETTYHSTVVSLKLDLKLQTENYFCLQELQNIITINFKYLSANEKIRKHSKNEIPS